MKNRIKVKAIRRVAGIIALLAVIGFPSFADDAQKSIIITGFSAQYNGKFGFFTLSNGQTTVAWATATISRNSTTFALVDWATDKPWGKDGNYSLVLLVYDTMQAAANKEAPIWTGVTTTISLNKRSTTVQFSQFVSQSESGTSSSSETTSKEGVMSAGGSHAMFIKADGSLYTWGNNNLGQLGNNTTTQSNTPVKIGSVTTWKIVSAGGGGDGWKYSGHAAALRANGTIWAWGNNERGATGLGKTDGTTNTPAQVGTATDWVSVSAGGSHTMAIKKNGTLWAWGDGENGRLGNGQSGSNYIISAPVQIGSDTNWKLVSAGESHTVAIKTNGTLWAWGSNIRGQLGDGTTTQRTAPIQIGNDSNWKFVSAGTYVTVALKTDGTLWAWGGNNYGQLGDGTTTDRNVPTKIGNERNWKSVSTGGNSSGAFTVAVKTNGTLWGWGQNLSGRNGQGTTSSGTTLVPTRIGTDSNWEDVSAGSNFALGVRTNGALWGWGSGTNGRLGQGNSNDRGSPVQINIP